VVERPGSLAALLFQLRGLYQVVEAREGLSWSDGVCRGAIWWRCAPRIRRFVDGWGEGVLPAVRNRGILALRKRAV